MMRSLRLLDRYLFTALVIAFTLTISSLVFIILFVQSFRLLSFVLNNAATALVFGRLMGLSVPPLLPVLFPISLAIAVLFVSHQLTADSEFSVMRATGISTRRLARPILILAGLVTLASLVTTLWIAPLANRERVQLEYHVRNTWSAFLVRPGTFNDIAPNLTFYAASRGPQGDLRDILVHDTRNPNRPITLMATSGRMSTINGHPHLTVFHGRRQELDQISGQMTELRFDSYVLNIDTARSSIANRRSPPREKTVRELWAASQNINASSSATSSFAELHQRLALPLFVGGYALLAFTTLVAGEHNRRGLGKRVLLAGLLLAFMQGASMSLVSLSSKQLWAIPLLYAVALLPIPVAWHRLKD